MFKYPHLVLGGTFDRFHTGHKSLIDLAFKLAKKVSIGITKKDFVKDKPLSFLIEDYDKRKKTLRQYLSKKDWLSRARLVPLADIYGTTLAEKDIDAVLVSKRTSKNALKINRKRRLIGFSPLKIIVASDVLADDGKLVTSERIRQGEIDREGRSYLKIFQGKEQLILPQQLREDLRKPLGRVFYGKEDHLEATARKTLQCFKTLKWPVVIAVGDIITLSLLKVGFNPSVKIIDFRSKRRQLDTAFFTLLRQLSSLPLSLPSPFINRPGTIESKTVEAVYRAIQKAVYKKEKPWVIVSGEEDLLTLPAILLSPLQSLVLYGHFKYGVIGVVVEEEIKNKTRKIIKKFTGFGEKI